MRSPVADLLYDARGAFARAEVDWYLFGAQAAILYGVARLTADVDITVRLPAATSAVTLAGELERGGFQLRVTDPDFVKRTAVMPFVHLATSLPLDVVLSGPGLEERFHARALVQIVEGVPVRIASVEDMVVMKILAGRPKDTADVEAIVQSQRTHLDVDYVRETLALLEDALGQNDLGPAFESAIARSRPPVRRSP